MKRESYEVLAEKARYFKQNEQGVATMCKLLEDMRSEVAEKTAKEVAEKTAKEIAMKMIEAGDLSLEKIANYLPTLSMEELKKLEAEVRQLA